MDSVNALAYIMTMTTIFVILAWLVERSRRKSIQQSLKSHSGGVIQRIDEMRQTAETIEKFAPDLFFRQPALLSWLIASDEFLCHLRDRSGLSDDPEWRGAPRPRNRGIYVRIQHLLKPAKKVA